MGNLARIWVSNEKTVIIGWVDGWNLVVPAGPCIMQFLVQEIKQWLGVVGYVFDSIEECRNSTSL